VVGGLIGRADQPAGHRRGERGDGDGTLHGKRITVWGAAFKPGTDDIRDSPALDVAEHLDRLGADVTVHDFQALDNAVKAHPNLTCIADPVEACEGADLLLHLTEWKQYADIDPAALRARVNTPSVLDGRDGLSPAK
jgi:UDPglucose 6-dehydrogenase